MIAGPLLVLAALAYFFLTSGRFHSYDVAQRQQSQALAALGGDPNIGDRAPQVMQAHAQLERARLNAGYATVVAPADGVVARVDQLPVGAYLNASQTAFWLLSGQPWIEA